MKNFTKKAVFVLILAFLLVNFTSCQNQMSSNNTHNAQNSLDYDGIYRGTLPCASCEGIKTTVYLNRDSTYKIITSYLGKEQNSQEETGKFTWDKTGTIIKLKDNNSSAVTQYFVGENTLTQLDKSGNKITGTLAPNYILSKDNYALLNKKWRPIELLGKPIILNEKHTKEPTLTFDDNSNRYLAVTDCNNISGGFEILPFNKLKFSPGMSTMMACESMEIEQKLGEVLKQADGFIINGDELTLIKGRMAPLAKFKTPMH